MRLFAVVRDGAGDRGAMRELGVRRWECKGMRVEMWGLRGMRIWRLVLCRSIMELGIMGLGIWMGRLMGDRLRIRGRLVGTVFERRREFEKD